MQSSVPRGMFTTELRLFTLEQTHCVLIKHLTVNFSVCLKLVVMFLLRSAKFGRQGNQALVVATSSEHVQCIIMSLGCQPQSLINLSKYTDKCLTFWVGQLGKNFVVDPYLKLILHTRFPF